jgi:MraZ protein
MLIGQYFSKITLKNRISLPKKFRSEIGDKLIIAKWYEECLVIVSEASWKEILKKLTGRTETLTKAVRDTDRFILGSAYEFELDLQGRFVIPSNLKEYAGLTDDLVFLGLGDRVELWNEKIWSEKEKAVQESAAEAIESISQKKSND